MAKFNTSPQGTHIRVFFVRFSRAGAGPASLESLQWFRLGFGFGWAFLSGGFRRGISDPGAFSGTIPKRGPSGDPDPSAEA